MKTQKEQLLVYLRKQRNKHPFASEKWAYYNTKIYKLENLKENEKHL